MKSIPYRVRIGVTGHRTLDNEIELKKQIFKVLNTEIPALFKSGLFPIRKGNTTELNYSVLTPLAEGADRLVAETVMEYDAMSCIEVVLPLTLSDYKKTFNNPDDPGFFELYNKARYVKQLRSHNLESDPGIIRNATETNIENRIEIARQVAFEQAGHYIVNHCHVLIALWDGKKSRGIGGTYEIIEYAISEKRPIIIISTKPPYKITVMNRMNQIVI